MALPENLEQAWLTEVIEYQQEVQMPLLSHLEIWAKEEGRQEGLQQTVQVLQDNITDLLESRFGSLNPEVQENIANLNDIPRLRFLFKQAITISSIEAFQQLLEEG